jgi:hypothetical protein
MESSIIQMYKHKSRNYAEIMGTSRIRSQSKSRTINLCNTDIGPRSERFQRVLMFNIIVACISDIYEYYQRLFENLNSISVRLFFSYVDD